MWLTGRLMPDFKTIANVRKNNSKAIRGVCRQFVVLCQQLGLFGDHLVAIDGSKLKAVNHRDRNFTSAKLKRRMEEVEASIARYMAALDAADRDESRPSGPTGGGLQEKIVKLKEPMKELQAIEVTLEASPDKQVSLTDPDARSMMSGGKGIVGYNVQTTVDTAGRISTLTPSLTLRGINRQPSAPLRFFNVGDQFASQRSDRMQRKPLLDRRRE